MNRDQLIEKMLDAFDNTKEELNDVLGTGRPRNSMSAALSVATEILLKEPTSEEKSVAANDYLNHNMLIARDYRAIFQATLKKFVASRAEAFARVKTLEERVTISRWVINPTRWVVLRDGWNPGNHDGFKDIKDAERYRRGLIEELKEAA
jgi:hypothetical protein